MASIGTISLSNASIGNISNISVKINGDPTERFISFNPSSGVITFDSLDDGFRYSYILLIEFDDQRIASAIFSHGCGEPVTTDAPITCTLPSSINIIGNTSPEVQSQETYTLSITGGSNNTYSWAVIGGTISGSNTLNTVNVQWGTDTISQSSVSVAVGCSGGDSITDTESFILQNPLIVDCVIADSVSISGSNNVVVGSTVSYSATVTGGYNNDLSWSVIGGTIIGSSTGSSVNIQWGTDVISQSSVTVTASCLGQSVSDTNTITITEGGTTSSTTSTTTTTTTTTLSSSCYVLYSAPFGGGTTTYVDEYGNNTSIVIPAQDEGLCFTICASSITNDPMGFVNKGVPCNSLDCNCNP